MEKLQVIKKWQVFAILAHSIKLLDLGTITNILCSPKVSEHLHVEAIGGFPMSGTEMSGTDEHLDAGTSKAWNWHSDLPDVVSIEIDAW